MRRMALLFFTAVLQAAPPQVVAQIDLARYMGTWHEIAKFPNRFQRGCGCTTATYALRPDGKVAVANRCRGVDGNPKLAKGWAKVVDPAVPGKLRVTFFWPFFGDYWVLALDPDYRHVLVGTPNRKYLWILARTPRMEESAYLALVQKAREQGFPVERLVRAEVCE